MKEATGDLNMTVVVVVIVAGLVAFFSMIVWPSIRGDIGREGNCSDAICEKNSCANGKCTSCRVKGGSDTFSCPFKG